MGAVLIAETIPRVLFLLLGGVVADRFSRRKVMIWSDSVRGLAVAAIAVLGQLNVLALWHLIVLGAIFGMASAFFFPAYQSIPPQLVDAEQLPSANALTGLSRQMSQLFGPALGATLVALSDPSAAFAIDALSFGVSAACLFALRLPPLPKAAEHDGRTRWRARDSRRYPRGAGLCAALAVALGDDYHRLARQRWACADAGRAAQAHQRCLWSGRLAARRDGNRHRRWLAWSRW